MNRLIFVLSAGAASLASTAAVAVGPGEPSGWGTTSGAGGAFIVGNLERPSETPVPSAPERVREATPADQSTPETKETHDAEPSKPPATEPGKLTPAPEPTKSAPIRPALAALEPVPPKAPPEPTEPAQKPRQESTKEPTAVATKPVATKAPAHGVPSAGGTVRFNTIDAAR